MGAGAGARSGQAVWRRTSRSSGPLARTRLPRPLSVNVRRAKRTFTQVRIGVVASHEGTTLQAVVDACVAGAIRGQVVAVISNNRESGALQRARAAGIPGYHLSSRTHPAPADLDAAISRILAESAADVVLLAGYMKQIGPETLGRFRGRILNTHPALLPKFGGKGMYGLHVHRAVLAASEAKSGASVHVVSEEYDAGPVLARGEVPVKPTDTAEILAERVQGRERSLVVEVLGAIAAGRIRLPAAEEWAA
jgi:phosphoribosylglycinamide formyltransferase-1